MTANAMSEPFAVHHHPAFSPPTQEQVPLWRYMDIPKFEWLIENARLYMPNVADFPDRLEGATPEGHKRWWRDQMAAAASEDAKAIISRNAAFFEDVAADWRRHYYVSCWHMNNSLNPRMWSEYTKTADAMAIRTTYRALRACLPPLVQIGIVRYIDYRSADLSSMNIMQRITHKDLRFAHEQELRAVAMRPIGPDEHQAEFMQHFFESESVPGVLVYAPRIEPSRLIVGVALHPHATEALTEKIRQLCASHNLPTPGAV